MTTEASRSQSPNNESALILFKDRLSDSPFIERVWRCHSERGGKFISVAASNFEMVLTRLGGQTFFTPTRTRNEGNDSRLSCGG